MNDEILEMELLSEVCPCYSEIEESLYLESLPDYIMRKYGRIEIFDDDYG